MDTRAVRLAVALALAAPGLGVVQVRAQGVAQANEAVTTTPAAVADMPAASGPAAGAVSGPAAGAASGPVARVDVAETTLPEDPGAELGYSSSAAATADLTASFRPKVTGVEAMARTGDDSKTVERMRPFSHIAVSFKGGLNGLGLDIATPVAQWVNLRVGGAFLQWSESFDWDGVTVNGELKLRDSNVMLDFFPFHNRFRVSVGADVYQGNNLNASAFVPGGQTFDLNDVTYTSSPTDPIHGTAALNFGWRQAPMLTLGAGNMLPRNHNHFSVPFEIGVQYIDPPTAHLYIAGTACNNEGCGKVDTDPDIQANLAGEQAQLDNDLKPLRFFPVGTIGFSWKF